MDLKTVSVSDDSSSSNSFVKISYRDLSDSEFNSELMKKYVECEEELKTTSLKLQESEQEIEKLKNESKKTAQRRVVDLETKLGQSYVQISNLKAMMTDSEKLELQCEINALKRDLVNRDQCIEALMKESEVHKQSYEMLMEENDEPCDLDMDELILDICWVLSFVVFVVILLLLYKLG